MQQNKLQKVLVMAGGTGGHIFPGLAVAECLKERGISVEWLGTQQGLEAQLVPQAGISLHFIRIAGLRGKGIKPLLFAPFKIIGAIKDAIRVIKTINPDIVIGMGGFVSGPGGVAAWLMRCPLIIHEQNAKAGLTNKILSLFSARTLQGFPAAFKANTKVVTIGNPVRSDIVNLPPPSERLSLHKPPFRLLVLGGSLGAQALNELVPQAIAQLPLADRPVILHQAGNKHIDLTKKQYEAMGVTVTLQAFVKDMAEAYGWADMVLCRAGALTVAELCVAGLGAIFVPFPHAVDDHQTENAHFMVKHEAALCIKQSELTATELARIIKQFSQSPEKCIAMAEAAYQLRKINVAEKIVQICQEVSR
ncbi:MAG: undecaprenyldiphospho-muramoylpentapeptide beta-N-acetylglucosaminyltransferase [Gammaproteobacteria bacterium]|nr:undecaprenyldiphospho-muramoylpentapeptide beta-N-acetylglucosaminyltransferase [Gammaproteobacteria bacterium]